MPTKPIKAPFPYFGGKQSLIHDMLPLLPPHEVYVEVFGGAGSLLFAKRPAPLEVFNDLDSELVNFFQVLRNDAAKLVKLLELTPYARSEYTFCRKNLTTSDDPIEAARRFYTAIFQSFGSSIGKSGWKHSVSTKGNSIAPRSWTGNIDHLMACAKRLRTVQIENDTFDRLIRAYDAPDVLYYCDPPYVTSTRRSGGYRHEMTNTQHAQLLQLICECKGMVILSGYDCPLYQEYLADWQRIDINVSASSAGNTRATGYQGKGSKAEQRRIESLWIKPNTQLPQQLSLFATNCAE